MKSNLPGQIYYKPYNKDLGDLQHLRDMAMPGSGKTFMYDDFDHDKRLYYTSQRAPTTEMTNMYHMSTTTEMYPTTPSPISVISVMPKSMPATRPYTVMTSPPMEESMYHMADQHSNFNRYERESGRSKARRNGMKR